MGYYSGRGLLWNALTGCAFLKYSCLFELKPWSINTLSHTPGPYVYLNLREQFITSTNTLADSGMQVIDTLFMGKFIIHKWQKWVIMYRLYMSSRLKKICMLKFLKNGSIKMHIPRILCKGSNPGSITLFPKGISVHI